MSLADEIAQEGANRVPMAQRTDRPDHPKGWEPGVVWDGTKGEITSKPVADQDPRWDVWLKSWGFDPELFRIVEPVQVRTWEAAVGNGETKQLWYYKAQIESRPEGHKRADVEELVKLASKSRPRKNPPPTGDQVFVVPIADPQLGKADGDGTEGTIKRMVERIDLVKDRYRALRKIGRRFGTLVIGDIGDSLEGVTGNYSTQTFTVELNQREQERIYRRLVMRMIQEWAPDFERVVVLAVPSNHCQNRQNGKIVSEVADDRGLANMEAIAEACAQSPALSHVSFVIPDDEQVVNLDLGGTVVAFTHSHQAPGGGAPQQKIKNWWANQSFGRQPAGDADLLVTGHYHHLSLIDHGPRLHLQCPSMDGGSKWFQDSSGASSRPGIVTFVTGAGTVLGDLEVL